ncbi:hypothetical protein CDAR_92681 [Caerostris darwini]|uniref:Uncharacterized protein n=1 Tax=Caerostris darwini TaxID=1538125 RepID=A0AAV4TNW0_9ARAC|nr:hypothetical protein CDAR_92681 [Caerostris darwini]
MLWETQNFIVYLSEQDSNRSEVVSRRTQYYERRWHSSNTSVVDWVCLDGAAIASLLNEEPATLNPVQFLLNFIWAKTR